LTGGPDPSHNRGMKLKTLLATVGALLSSLAPAAELQPGDVAPDFTLGASDGKTYTLSDYRGNQAVVLAWFPKAFTGG
jgi:thioredoxin-dependent peroxiredoxin